jgi:hypothetical protein
LKYVTLGIGHQNYSCDATGKLTATGATAVLYNVKSALTHASWLTPSLPGLALSYSGLRSDNVASNAVKGGDAEDFSRNLNAGGIEGLDKLGIHFFTDDKAPLFNLYEADTPGRLVGKVFQKTPAPQGSCAGPEGTGAVDWLLLEDDKTGRSYGGLTNVYRVETAGGQPPKTCSGMAPGSIVRVPYAAEYWFYGPLAQTPQTY